MPSTRTIQVLFTSLAVLLAFTLLNHGLRHDSENSFQQSTVDIFSHVSEHVSEKITPWFGGSTAQHIKANELVYNDVLQQRAALLQEWEALSPAGPDLFACRDAESCAVTPFSIWDLIPASWNCPHTMRRLGRLGHGGKWVCGLERLASLPKSRKAAPQQARDQLPPSQVPQLQSESSGLKPGHQAGCIIYALGNQSASTFEAQLLSYTPNCQIWAYDLHTNSFGPSMEGFVNEHRAHLSKVGISGQTDTHVSVTGEAIPFFSVQDLMALNQHDHIDVLKLDVHGDEFDVLRGVFEHFMSSSGEEKVKRGQQPPEVPIAQIVVHIHVDEDRFGVEDFLGWWSVLENIGYRPVSMEVDLLSMVMGREGDGLPREAEYSLINVRDRKSPFL